MTKDLLVTPLKMLCPETLLGNPDLNISKKIQKMKANCIPTDGLYFL